MLGTESTRPYGEVTEIAKFSILRATLGGAGAIFALMTSICIFVLALIFSMKSLFLH